jgi:S1-C subfamily serine protease
LVWAWWVTFTALLLAIAGLALYLALRKPDIVYRILPPPPPDAQQQSILDQARQRAEALGKDIAAMRAALQAYICPPGMIKDPTAPPISIPPPSGNGGLGMLPDTTQPPAIATAAAAVLASPSAAGAQPLGQHELVDLLTRAVVLVLTQDSSASGFFIAPDYIATNRHAVETARDGQVGVTSKALGRLHIGRVVAATSLGPKGADDYALIHLDDLRSASFLRLALPHEALMPIVSAGYPGLTISNDQGFRRLLAGDISAAPELVLSRGDVQAVQKSAAGIEVLVHSGDVMQGDSGGPVLDHCGRAIGMNTYIAVDEQQSGRVSYALAAAGLASFIQRSGVAASVETSACPG